MHFVFLRFTEFLEWLKIREHARHIQKISTSICACLIRNHLTHRQKPHCCLFYLRFLDAQVLKRNLTTFQMLVDQFVVIEPRYSLYIVDDVLINILFYTMQASLPNLNILLGKTTSFHIAALHIYGVFTRSLCLLHP